MTGPKLRLTVHGRALELHSPTVDLAAAHCQRRTRTSAAFCISSKVAPSAMLEKTICAFAAALSAVARGVRAGLTCLTEHVAAAATA